MDAGYGGNTDLRTGITRWDCAMSPASRPNTTVWAPGTGPLPPKKWSGQGRPPKLIRRDDKHRPISVKATRARPAQARLAHDQMARRRGRVAVLALCARAGSCRASRLQSHREPAGRMAADRVARGRGRADQILALDPSARHRLPLAGRHRQAALAHRARLSGAQAGGRARAFRRARMARLPSPRHAVHRSLRIPDLRAGDDSPLRTSFHHAVPGTCRTRRLPTQRLRRLRPERHIPNSIATMRRRLIVALVRTLSRCPCCDAPIAETARGAKIHDAVRLGWLIGIPAPSQSCGAEPGSQYRL